MLAQALDVPAQLEIKGLEDCRAILVTVRQRVGRMPELMAVGSASFDPPHPPEMVGKRVTFRLVPPTGDETIFEGSVVRAKWSGANGRIAIRALPAVSSHVLVRRLRSFPARSPAAMPTH